MAANESMATRAAAYQSRIARRAGVYEVNAVKCDAYANGLLQEAKGPGYAKVARNGQFVPWFRGADGLASQSERQLAAAGGTPMWWSVAEPEAATAIRNLFGERDISRISVKLCAAWTVSDPVYLAAYGGPRRELSAECPDRLSRCLTSLARDSELLGAWYLKANRKAQATQVPVSVEPGGLAALLQSGENRRDVDRAPIAELGFSAGLWNGEFERAAGLAVKCGAWSPVVPNSFVLNLPAADDGAAGLYEPETARAMMRAVIGSWEPEWATWTSHSLREVRSAEPGAPVLGWATYLSSGRCPNYLRASKSSLSAPVCSSRSVYPGRGPSVAAARDPRASFIADLMAELEPLSPAGEGRPYFARGPNLLDRIFGVQIHAPVL